MLALLPAGRVACSEIEEVVSGDADGIVTCGLLAAGVAPTRHDVQSARMRHGYIGKQTACAKRGTLMTCLWSKAGVPVSLATARMAADDASTCIQFAALPCALNSTPSVSLMSL